MNMKKMLSLALAGVMALSLMACSAQNGGGAPGIGHRQTGANVRQTPRSGQRIHAQLHDPQRRGTGRLRRTLHNALPRGIVLGYAIGAAQRQEALRVRRRLLQQLVL